MGEVVMIYQLPELALFSDIVHGFSTRDAGNMSFRWGEVASVTENRKRFLDQLGLGAGRGVTAELVHGDEVLRVGEKEAGQDMLQPDYHLQADGLITNEPGVYLFHVVADCASILYYDPVHRAIGLAHAGWRGAELELPKKTIARMQAEFFSNPAELVVGVGPAIQKCCYAFPDPVRSISAQWEPYLTSDAAGHTHIDLIGLIVRQLMEAGIRDKSLFVSEDCTGHSGKFFSHHCDRRDNNPNEQRFAALIGLKA